MSGPATRYWEHAASRVPNRAVPFSATGEPFPDNAFTPENLTPKKMAASQGLPRTRRPARPPSGLRRGPAGRPVQPACPVRIRAGEIAALGALRRRHHHSPRRRLRSFRASDDSLHKRRVHDRLSRNPQAASQDARQLDPDRRQRQQLSSGRQRQRTIYIHRQQLGRALRRLLVLSAHLRPQRNLYPFLHRAWRSTLL